MKDPIVWIDDDYNKSQLSEFLEDRFDITDIRTVRETLESLEKLKQARFIIFDMIIPNGPEEVRFGYYSGLELLGELRDRYGITTPILVLTAVERADVLAQLTKLGVSETLIKPVLGSELLEAVDRLLEHQENQPGTRDAP